MKIIECEQGSVEWMQARAAIPTASEFDALVSPTGEIRKGKMPASYLAKKLAEKWQGGPLLSFNTFDMEQGHVVEEIARPWYEAKFDVVVNQVGFITTDDGRVGCSPDGMLEDGTGLEIKAPLAETHVKYLLGGKVPEDYIAQVQGSLYVTGAASWKFLSFRRNFPPLLLDVLPDTDYQEALAEALELFHSHFETGWKQLCERNGGPPKRKPAPEQPQPEREVFDYRH